jgi:signal transduction histidine kinase
MSKAASVSDRYRPGKTINLVLRGRALAARTAMAALLKRIVREARGLQCRSTILLAFVVAAATGLSGALYFRIVSRLTLQRAQIHARELAKSLAVASVEPMLDSDRAALLRIAQQLGSDERLAYVAFADVSGRILAGSQHGQGQLKRWLFEDGERISVEPLNKPVLLSDRELGPRVDIVWPIEETAENTKELTARPVLGFVRLGLSLTEPERQLAAVARQVSAISIGIALLMVPLGFEIVRRIVAPLSQLAKAARALKLGQLHTRVRIERNDEIGDLANSFNGMADELARSHNALVRLNAELEDRVLRRTEELAESNRLLQIGMSEREELLRAVSHDLHAPLRNIDGLCTLFRRKESAVISEGAEHILARIEHNVRYGVSMIDELLELSRIREQRDCVHELDLQHEVQNIIQQLGYEIDRKGIDVIIERPLPKLRIDRRRIRHVFQNLIDNAIKYTPDAQPESAYRSTIKISWTELPNEYRFRVADRGVGIREEDRERIFLVFNRGRSEYVSRTTGKGVGLAYCRNIVQTYGGRIWVEDNPGGGSVFCLTLDKAALGARNGPSRRPSHKRTKAAQPISKEVSA